MKKILLSFSPHFCSQDMIFLLGTENREATESEYKTPISPGVILLTMKEAIFNIS
jgi:hypothetical protein